MRVLAHIHTFNDEDVIDRSLGALLGQTRPADGIVLVDNGSSDRTLARAFPPGVTVIRHRENLGTSGAIITGLRHGLEKGYDWVWVLDGDSAPRPDALEKLVRLWEALPPETQAGIRALASLPVEHTTGEPYQQVVFTAAGVELVGPRAEDGKDYYEFDGAIWTGCMFKLAAVRRIGLPSADYVLDWAEYEYGYQGKRHGLRALMCPSSIVDHNIGGPRSFAMTDLPPIRLYYNTRNTLYFWLYEFEPRRAGVILRQLVGSLALLGTFLARPSERRKRAAVLRGIWDGVRGRIERRF